MRLKVTKIEDAQHPTQVSVSINGVDGTHYLVINKRSLLQDNLIEVGQPVGVRGKERLVELPEETDGGVWRVWVDESDIVGPSLQAAE